MEDEGRMFEAVKIGMASFETGRERFTTDGYGHVPHPAFWRLNLTALSQRYNLYFIAIGSHIHVYQPQFPFQKLGGKQKLTVSPQLANDQALGYINPHHPHYINNLLIGQLGEQEILLLSTDSGNVTGYETKSFINAIRNNDVSASLGTPLLNHADLRPFFLQWVVESAWGLSIHSKARMIAVSANASPRNAVEAAGVWEERGSITVFAFALTSETRQEPTENSIDMQNDMLDVEHEWREWVTSGTSPDATSPPRNHNYKIALSGMSGHPTNIPNVAFINTPEDQTGSWILSTDVNENVKLWQIWTGKCTKTWQFRDHVVGGAAWLGAEERGWFAVALDRRAFRPVSDVESLIGHRRAPQYYGYDAQGDSFDITNVVRHHVPSNAWNHPHYASDSDESDSSMGEHIEVVDQLSDFETSDEEAGALRSERLQNQQQITDPCLRNISEDVELTAMDLDTEGFSQPLDSMQLSEDSSEDEDNFLVRSDFSEGNASEHDFHGGSNLGRRSETSSLTDSPEDSPSDSLQRSHETIIEASMYSASPTTASSARRKPGQCMSPSAAHTISGRPLVIPNVPFLYCSSSHLRLFDSIKTRSPHLFCAGLLKQSISATMEDQGIFQMDRLDMVEQIPELGIVVIATQVGRCAVCSLTKRKADGLLGLRVDWILPTKEQERAGQRPQLPLHGIAISPIQGRYASHIMSDPSRNAKLWARDRVVDGVATTFDQTVLDVQANETAAYSENTLRKSSMPMSDPRTNIDGMKVKAFDWSSCQAQESWQAVDGRRRYRLMMTYADMTVLTYEISRGEEREDTKVVSSSHT